MLCMISQRVILTVPCATVDLHSHADRPLEVAVRVEADFGRQEHRVEVSLHRRIRVAVAWRKNIVSFNTLILTLEITKLAKKM